LKNNLLVYELAQDRACWTCTVWWWWTFKFHNNNSMAQGRHWI